MLPINIGYVLSFTNISTMSFTSSSCIQFKCMQLKYSVGGHPSSRRILIRYKWSYCKLLKGLGKTRERVSYCSGEHLAGLLGGVINYWGPLFYLFLHSALRLLVLSIPLCHLLFPPPTVHSSLFSGHLN